MAAILWFVGLLGLVVATLFASSRGRAKGAEVVERGVIGAAAVAYVALVAAAVWTWGGVTASRGRADRLHDGALVHIAIDGVRVSLDHPIAIGHAASADVRVPGDGGELARIEPAGGGAVVVHGTRLAPVHSAASAPAAATARGCTPADASYVLPPGAALVAVECSDAAGAHGDAAGAVRSDAAEAHPRAVIIRNDRDGAGPSIVVTPLAWRGKFVTEQLTARAGDALRIAGGDDAIPGLTTWDVTAPRGAATMLAIPADPTDCGAWTFDQRQAAAPAEAGGGDDAPSHGENPGEAAKPPGEPAKPNDGATPRGATTPPDPKPHILTPGAAVPTIGVADPEGDWVQTDLVYRPGNSLQLDIGAPKPASKATGTAKPDAKAAKPDAARAPATAAAPTAGPPTAGTSTAGPRDGRGRSTPTAGGGCRVESGAFTLAALPLVPDADAVIARGARAAFAIGTPSLLLLLALVLSPRRERRSRVVGQALRLCVLGAGLTALCCWRLLWAYRIDMLRDLATVGSRLVENQLAVIGIGAALAGNAVLAHDALSGASVGRRGMFALIGWATWLVIGSLVSGALPPLTVTHAGVLGLSLLAGLAPVVFVVGQRATERLGPAVALLAIAVGGAVGRSMAPRAALGKLGLAFGFVLAAHAALRIGLRRETSARDRIAGVAMIGLAALSLARYDAGVTLAIAGVGLVLAMLVAGHDAAYDASQAQRIGLLEREHARLLAVHGLAGIAIAIFVAACAALATDRALIERGAPFVIHAPLVVAGLFALAAIVARSHRRGWAPWLCAALAALAIWGVRDSLLERATGGSNVGARRVAAVIEPGYALLTDERTFVANASAWREASLARSGDIDPATGEGYFGARVRDIGVARSIDNDYLPVLVARETGVGGLVQTIALLLVLAIGSGAIASVRLRHASREHRARWLITAVVAALAVYQPLASLGVLPLTGISWPGFGIDSPADIWLFAIGAIWCMCCGGAEVDDERVRSTARLRRARGIVMGALGTAAIAAVIIVARAGSSALGRVAAEDQRIDDALRYASSIACPWPEHDGATADAVVPPLIAGTPRDEATARFDREMRAGWSRDRTLLVAALPECRERAGRWKLARDGAACVATLDAGLPTIEVRSAPGAAGLHASCKVGLSEELIASLRTPTHSARGQRVRVVSAALGATATDVGELVAGARIVRLRPGAPEIDLAAVTAPATASRIAIAGDVTLDVRPTPRGVVLHGGAELFVAEPGTPPVWRRTEHGPEVLLDKVTLIAAGTAEHRVVALFRPPREWAGSGPVVDALLADDTTSVGDRPRRMYPYGATLPELGWVNPFDVDHSLGLDGWVHAALRRDKKVNDKPVEACGTLAPPAVAPDRVCSASPLDGVLECRVTLQPELVGKLTALTEELIADPKPRTGKDVTPVRAGFVVLRGDTGELLAQGTVIPGRERLAYAPTTPAAESRLIALREARGESDAERVDWNLPIAVGSTLKPVVSRAAEEAFPRELASLTLTAAGHAAGCRAHRGVDVDPLLGQCPPTSLAGEPTTADVHDFLARSPNWYMAALGILGLGLPANTFAVKGQPVTLADITATDLATWPASDPLEISDSKGPIVSGHNVILDGVRRTPLWSRIEALLGRPLCTLGDRAHCEAAAERADVCVARSLPIASPTRDLRYLVALGPDRIDMYGDDRPAQTKVPIREYFQLLRGSGVHAIGSLAQLTDAFGRVIFDPSPGAPQLAASWFPAPAVGTLPAWSCSKGSGHEPAVLGADGGLCAVVQSGTARGHLGDLLADPNLVIYGAKTGTVDSLADIARHAATCETWNAHHPAGSQLVCGKTPPDDSLFVIAFGVVTPHGTIPITLGIHLQRAGKGAAANATPAFVHAIADYLK